GICCRFQSNPQILNNEIMNNQAVKGGGIACIDNSSPAIQGNSVTGAAELFGGGIYIYDAYKSEGELLDPDLVYTVGPNNNVAACTAGSHGGGVYFSQENEQHSQLIIVENVIEENTAGYGTQLGSGGGVFCDHSKEPHVVGNVIDGNVAYGDGGQSWAGGGGLYLQNCTSPIANGLIAENRVINNSSISGVGGGLVYVDAPGVTIERNIVRANQCDAAGGGIYVYQTSVQTSIFNNLVAYNVVNSVAGASGGGGMYLGDSGVLLKHNTVIYNSVGSYGNGGGVNAASCVGYHCIFCYNTVNGVGPGSQLYGSYCTVHWSDVEGGWSGPGSYNFDAPPGFETGYQAFLYRLGPYSP
ncbi:MAG: hypothetical protein AB1744_15970, partial [Candidatus Zixiibacteriota bacterium]